MIRNSKGTLRKFDVLKKLKLQNSKGGSFEIFFLNIIVNPPQDAQDLDNTCAVCLTKEDGLCFNVGIPPAQLVQIDLPIVISVVLEQLEIKLLTTNRKLTKPEKDYV